MNILKALQRPEYIYRPRQIVRRLNYPRIEKDDEVNVSLPWDLPITVCPGETLGRAICTLGLDDLAVCEALWRLMPPGGTAVDVGANIGQMTSLLARRAGRRGKVIAIEPERRNLSFLRRNVAVWNSSGTTAPIDIIECAAADFEGEISLYLPTAISGNRGLASIIPEASVAEEQKVRAAPLSSLLRDIAKIDIMKIDVEGAEDRVLDGYAAELAAGRVSVIVAEEHRPLPTPLTRRLEAAGYAVFLLLATFNGPMLASAAAVTLRPRNQAPSVVAVRPDRFDPRVFTQRGWQCLRGTLI